MRNLSSSEVQALSAIFDEAIIKSQEDDGDPVFEEVDVETVNPFDTKVAQNLVYDSLAKKGLIECSMMETAFGEVTEFVCITPKGLKALKSAKGVH